MLCNLPMPQFPPQWSKAILQSCWEDIVRYEITVILSAHAQSLPVLTMRDRKRLRFRLQMRKWKFLRKVVLDSFTQQALSGYLPGAGPNSSMGREARVVQPQGCPGGRIKEQRIKG